VTIDGGTGSEEAELLRYALPTWWEELCSSPNDEAWETPKRTAQA
jgi:hypothetical protein